MASAKRPPTKAAAKPSATRELKASQLDAQDRESKSVDLALAALGESSNAQVLVATKASATAHAANAHLPRQPAHPDEADVGVWRPRGPTAKMGGANADDTRAERSGSFEGLIKITDAERGRGTSMDAVFKKIPIAVGGVVFSEAGSDVHGGKGLGMVVKSLACCFGQSCHGHGGRHGHGGNGHGDVATSPSRDARIPSADETPFAAEGWQSALVFLKPHAAGSKAAAALVRKVLASHQIEVAMEGVVGAKQIADEGKIDAHYGAIANRAVVQLPHALVVPAAGQAAFQMRFGQSWQAALEHGKVLNAAAAAERLRVGALGLERAWRLIPKDDVLKFGGGFYCGRLGPPGEGPDSPDVFYCVNGFYLQMRAGFVAPGAQVRWFSVRWAVAQLSWQRFRAEVVGATNPERAVAGSLRRCLLEQWKQLGLAEPLSTGLNGVHASASALEGLFERVNWLGLAGVEADPFGRALVAQGVPAEVLAGWARDPPVVFEGAPQSVFDLHEGLDAEPCLRKAAAVHASDAKAQAMLTRSVSRAKQW